MSKKLTSLEIKRPSLDLMPSYLSFMEEMKKNGDKVWEGYFPKEGESSIGFIEKQLRREIKPEGSLVTETIYWGVDSGHTVVGRISLRHTLNESLAKFGGHIGYEVHPHYRKLGVATRLLKELLKTAKAKEIGKLLLTCHPDNVGSNKTILSNGGVLLQKVFVESVGEFRNHYWITL